MQKILWYGPHRARPLKWVTQADGVGEPCHFLTVDRADEPKNPYERIAAVHKLPLIVPREGLFLEFAKLPPTLPAILEFATRYGFLGIARKMNPDPSRKIDPLELVTLRSGERLEDWQHEIHVMRYAVDLWRTTREGEAPDADLLERYIHWLPHANARDEEGKVLEGREWVVFASHPIGEFEADKAPPTHHIACIATQNDAGLFETTDKVQFARFDRLKAAALYLRQEVDRHFSVESEDHLPHHPPSQKVALRVVWDDKAQRQTSVLVPDNLLALMWVQFHEAIAGRAVFQQCQRCDAWFRPKKARGQARLWCSGSCRVQNSRQRNGSRKSSQQHA